MDDDKIALIRTELEDKNFEPFITNITFPHFKNFEEKTSIDFTFPLTAIVGENGASKSSILHALYGAPENNNISDFWFSTAIDPIVESEKRNCYFYRYYNQEADREVEVLLQRSPYRKRGGDPDYWESSRPVKEYGMMPFPKKEKGEDNIPGGSSTRWNMLKKHVEHIDFRASLPAFDKFFYHDSFSIKDKKTKKKAIRRRSKHLKDAIENSLKVGTYYTKENRIKGCNEELSSAMVKSISNILGKEYTKIHLIRHTYYGPDAYTAQMQTNHLNYTEAFAGSGEFSVVNLVYKIDSAPKKSLILLDEPEVSLHPGAQEKLVKYLYNQILANKHQIVIATHSPTFIRHLPNDAIKVLGKNSLTNKTVLKSQKSMPEEAFFQLGELSDKFLTIVVEDRLAEELIKNSLKRYPEPVKRLIKTKFYPGGVSVLWSYYIPVCASDERKDIAFILDGDMRPKEHVPKSSGIPQSDDSKISGYVKILANDNLAEIPIDGGTDKAKKMMSKIHNGRKLIDWSIENVFYLPGDSCPEGLLWQLNDPDTCPEQVSTKDAKSYFECYTRGKLKIPDNEHVPSSDIFADQKRLIADTDPETPEMKEIDHLVDSIIERFRKTGHPK